MTVREDSRRLLIVNKEFFSSSRYGTRTYHPYRLFFYARWMTIWNMRSTRFSLLVNPNPFLFRKVGIKTQINGILDYKFQDEDR